MTDAPAPAHLAEGPPDSPAGPAPAAFLALDRGTATCAASLVGRVGRGWRLLAAAAGPAGADAAALADLLVDRLRAADPGIAHAAGLDAAGEAQAAARAASVPEMPWPPRLEAASVAAPLAAIVATTEAVRERLVGEAAAAGWRTVSASAELLEPLAATRLATRPDVALLVAGTADPPSADERDLVGELVALVAAIAERRPATPVLLIGGAAPHAPSFPLETEVVTLGRSSGDAAGGLRATLAARRAGRGDARRALASITGTLAELLGLRVELLEVGMSGAVRARATPAARPGDPAELVSGEAPSAALGLADDDAALDRIEAWTTLAVDRARLRDRLAELRLAPWADLGGDGALLRAAALRASIERLVEATGGVLDGPPPDLLVLAGGAWSAVPPPAALLVAADGVRRAGVVQVAFDPARLLAPLGAIDVPADRARVAGDLLDDVLVPLGTLVEATGARGRPAGRLRLLGEVEVSEVELAAGGISLVDLPPGQRGILDLSFRGAVGLGVRGRRFAARATGGLAGLVVDLRDAPLRLPDRPDERRGVLARWERALWPERER